MTLERSIPVLNDGDVEALADMVEIIRICDDAVVAAALDNLTAPARQTVDFGAGRLVFTAGGNNRAVGFRAYETFPGSRQEQVVAVWHPGSGRLAGVVVGELLGALRTGALGGVAVDRLTAPDAHVCAVIGTGLQARTQLLACAAVRSLSEVRVFSRNEAGRRAFAHEMAVRTGVDVVATKSAARAVAGAQVVLLATSSGVPVVALEDLDPDAHVSTVGPKLAEFCELHPDVVESASIIATDSPRQIRSQGASHFLHGSDAWDRIEHLGAIEVSPSRTGRSVYLSAGLAGTEVLIADARLQIPGQAAEGS